jgi:hypothetical protein
MSLLINGLFAQSLRLPRSSGRWYWGYAQKTILGISNICLWLFFSHLLIGFGVFLQDHEVSNFEFRLKSIARDAFITAWALFQHESVLYVDESVHTRRSI